MNVLLIGSGGREHAIALKVLESSKLTKLFCLPGNAGIGKECDLVNIKQNDKPAILDFIKSKKIDFVIVGPEQPLADGLVNLLREKNIAVFGPSKEAAELESSKAFAKYFMEKYNIPTAGFKVFSRNEKQLLLEYLKKSNYPVVIKADGLAAGKGVVIPQSYKEAEKNINEFIEDNIFGSAADKIVIEEFLQGEEASVFAVSDGSSYVLLSPAQDHKRINDNDEGKNTGGMGSYAPAPVITKELMKIVEEKVVKPTIEGMNSEGKPFTGCLYCGLMITHDGPKVIEYNCRFGDPETQVILPLIESDLLELLFLASTKGLKNYRIKHSDKTAVCVVLASKGYPDKYETGNIISGFDELDNSTLVYHAGTKYINNKIATSGGRVLGITVLGNNLNDAIEKVYLQADKVHFDGCHYRTDIGKKGLKYFEGKK
jgi:phosphoribosylamine---glycine ligase